MILSLLPKNGETSDDEEERETIDENVEEEELEVGICNLFDVLAEEYIEVMDNNMQPKGDGEIQIDVAENLVAEPLQPSSNKGNNNKILYCNLIFQNLLYYCYSTIRRC